MGATASMNAGLFSGSDGRYRLAFAAAGIELAVDRLRRERHELVGELSVSCGIVGARAIDGVLSVGSFNLSSPAAAAQRAKLLAERARSNGSIPWSDMLEELRQRVLTADRVGAPAISLRDVALESDADAELDVLGLTFPRSHPTILFGDGGTGKSFLALQVLCALAVQGLRVALLDWEMDAAAHRQRLAALCGDELPDLKYVRLDRPLVHEADRLRRIVERDRLDFAVLDSAGYGTAGAPESAEAAMDYFRAVRQLGIGTIILAHITKAEGGDQRPFGSAFWANSARCTWFARLASTSADGGTLQLALFNRKANVARLRPPIGIRLEFASGRAFFSRADVATMDEVADKLPLWQRVRAVVQSAPMTLAAIADELGAPVRSVEKAVERDKGRLFTKVPGTDGVTRIALVSRRSA